MKFNITVKTGAKRAESVQETSNGGLMIITHAKPIDGEANTSVISLLSNYFKIPKSRIKIISGLKSKNKIVEVM